MTARVECQKRKRQLTGNRQPQVIGIPSHVFKAHAGQNSLTRLLLRNGVLCIISPWSLLSFVPSSSLQCRDMSGEQVFTTSRDSIFTILSWIIIQRFAALFGRQVHMFIINRTFWWRQCTWLAKQRSSMSQCSSLLATFLATRREQPRSSSTMSSCSCRSYTSTSPSTTHTGRWRVFL